MIEFASVSVSLFSHVSSVVYRDLSLRNSRSCSLSTFHPSWSCRCVLFPNQSSTSCCAPLLPVNYWVHCLVKSHCHCSSHHGRWTVGDAVLSGVILKRIDVDDGPAWRCFEWSASLVDSASATTKHPASSHSRAVRGAWMVGLRERTSHVAADRGDTVLAVALAVVVLQSVVASRAQREQIQQRLSQLVIPAVSYFP
jgi:hypothetical protein